MGGGLGTGLEGCGEIHEEVEAGTGRRYWNGSSNAPAPQEHSDPLIDGVVAVPKDSHSTSQVERLPTEVLLLPLTVLNLYFPAFDTM